MNEKEEIKIEDTISVLEGKPTINERLDKLEAMMTEILARLPLQYDNNQHYTTTYFNTNALSCTSNSYKFNK